MVYGSLSNPTSSALFKDFSFSIRDGGLFEMAGGRCDVTVINLTDYRSLRRTDRSFGKKRNQEDVLQDFTDFKECYGDQVPEEVLMLYASKGGTILGSSSYELFFDYDRFYKDIRNALQSNGGLSLAEAKAHWKGGTAEPLHYPLSSINLLHIHDQDFDYVGQKKYFNLFFRGVGDDRFVYGNIRLEYLGNGKVKAPDSYYDVYDFDYRKNWNAKDIIRDVNTFFGRLYNGSGTPYRIYLSGEANLGIIIHMPNPGDVYGGSKF